VRLIKIFIKKKKNRGGSFALVKKNFWGKLFIPPPPSRSSPLPQSILGNFIH